MAPTTPARTPAIAVAAWAAAAAASLTATATAVLLSTGDSAGTAPVKPLLLTAVWVVPGLLIALARPRIALGWLALGEALLFAASALGDTWIRHVADGPGADVAWAAWVTDRFSAFLAVGVWLVLVLLPDGRLPSRRWRPVVAAVVAVQCLALLVFATTRGPAVGPDTSLPDLARGEANPMGLVPAGIGERVMGLDTLLLQVPLLICLIAHGVRLRRARPEERVRIVGVLLAAATFVLLVVLGHAWLPRVAEALDVFAGALLSAQLTAMVLSRRVRAVTVATRQAFVYTVLTAVVGGLAVGVGGLLAAVGQDLPSFGVAVVAGGTALAVHPVRIRLERLVDRLLHGDLHDPYRALQRLAEQTHRAPTVDAVLEGLAATVAASLQVPWSSATAGGHVGTWGEHPGGGEDCADLVSGSGRMGSLVVSAGAGRGLRADEQRLLADLGRHGGVAVQAVLLSEALRGSRQRLVVAREEERRRLRRDLHDGVGPTLAGLSMQLGAVRPLVRSDPDAVADRLGTLQDAARGALDTVRRLSHGLRPPALDELGLAGALRQLAESLGLRLGFAGTEALRLPAAVEVAVYLIAAEALHNVVRHAGTCDVEVSLHADEKDVTLLVRDSGAGGDGAGTVGIGLMTMRERADELGGVVTVDSAHGGGTTVTARLPLRETGAVVLT